MTDTRSSSGTNDALNGLAERLDRLLLTSQDNDRFVLSTESAKNIVGIVREWLRTRTPALPMTVREAWQIDELKSKYQPSTAAYEREHLVKRIKAQGPSAVASMLHGYAVSQPSQGSFAGSLWAISEWISTHAGPGPLSPQAQAGEPHRLDPFPFRGTDARLFNIACIVDPSIQLSTTPESMREEALRKAKEIAGACGAAQPSSGTAELTACEADGFAASLLQQVVWIEESVDGTVPPSQRLDLSDVDLDELRGAAHFIQRQAAEIVRLRAAAQASPVMEFPLDAGLHNLAFPEPAQGGQERIAELQYEAGMYKCLYENAAETIAKMAETFSDQGRDGHQIAKAVRASVVSSTSGGTAA